MQRTRQVIFAAAVSTGISVGSAGLARCAPMEEKKMTVAASSSSSVSQQIYKTPAVARASIIQLPVPRIGSKYSFSSLDTNPYDYTTTAYTKTYRNIRLEKITKQLHSAKRASDAGNRTSNEANKDIGALGGKLAATIIVLYALKKGLDKISDLFYQITGI